jgi:hypothetical protein
MATGPKEMWLKVLLGLMITMMLLGAKVIDGKVSKEVFNQHQEYQNTQFDDIKASLKRIEGKK